MKNNILLFIFTLVLLLLYHPFSLLATRAQEGQDVREKEHEPIVEEVTVTNIEVPVRVLHKGKPVTNLTRDDFTLYENKKKMEINAFLLKRKKLKVTGTKEVADTPKLSQPRTLVLSFSITDFNEDLEKAVEHLFTNILKTNDRLLVFANDKTLGYPNLREKDTIKQQLRTVLKEESKKARHKLITYVSKIEAYINVSDLKRDKDVGAKEKPSLRVFNFLKKYKRTWNDYKKRFLMHKNFAWYINSY